MKLIIPMAGRGTRVRPHSHVTPKPLLKVKGKNLVERIVDTFTQVLPRPIDEAVYIIGPDFGADIRQELTALSEARGIRPRFTVQEQALGTAHAVDCAGDALTGEGIVVYADTLFEMDPGVNLEGADVIAWVKHVEDPRRFGVAVREGDRVVAFVEKPQTLISNEALIGIYYVKDLARLHAIIRAMIDAGRRGPGGEFFLTDAFDEMLREDAVFKTASVREWLDCGTIPALMETTRFYLDKERDDLRQGEVENSVVIEPVYVGPGARVVDSVVGPYVAIEAGAQVSGSVVRESILYGQAQVEGVVLDGSLVGRHAEVRGAARHINIGDHSTLEG